jgi:hypothetical protein
MIGGGHQAGFGESTLNAKCTERATGSKFGQTLLLRMFLPSDEDHQWKCKGSEESKGGGEGATRKAALGRIGRVLEGFWGGCQRIKIASFRGGRGSASGAFWGNYETFRAWCLSLGGCKRRLVAQPASAGSGFGARRALSLVGPPPSCSRRLRFPFFRSASRPSPSTSTVPTSVRRRAGGRCGRCALCALGRDASLVWQWRPGGRN